MLKQMCGMARRQARPGLGVIMCCLCVMRASWAMHKNQLRVVCCWTFSLQLFFGDKKWCMTLNVSHNRKWVANYCLVTTGMVRRMSLRVGLLSAKVSTEMFGCVLLRVGLHLVGASAEMVECMLLRVGLLLQVGLLVVRVLTRMV